MEIVLIVCIAVCVLAAMDHYATIKKRKIDAALRMREMEAGVAPGTYSRYSKKDARKAKKKHSDVFDEDIYKDHSEEDKLEREELLKGIQDLKARIENIDTIMASRKKDAKGEEE